MPTPVLADGDLGTVMNLLLIRFGIIAAGVAVLAIVLFAVALTLKRKGKLGSAVKRIAPLAQSYADSRATGNRYGARNRRGGWKTGASQAVAHYLSEQAKRKDR